MAEYRRLTDDSRIPEPPPPLPPIITVTPHAELGPLAWGGVIVALVPVALFAAISVELQLVPQAKFDIGWLPMGCNLALICAIYYLGVSHYRPMSLRSRVVGGFAIIYMAIGGGLLAGQIVYNVLTLAQGLALAVPLVTAFLVARQTGYFIGPPVRGAYRPRGFAP